MRNKRTGRKLGVVTKHRKAMFRNMATDLFKHESITTTDTRAKEIRRVAEKIITLAKKGTLQSRRQAAAFIKDKDVLKKLFNELAEKYRDRPGGYTRIIKMGYRKGDNAPLSQIEIVQENYKPKKKKKIKQKTTVKQTAESIKKSTKKESAEELGLIDDTTKSAATETVADDIIETSEQTENTETNTTDLAEAAEITETDAEKLSKESPVEKDDIPNDSIVAEEQVAEDNIATSELNSESDTTSAELSETKDKEKDTK